MGAPFSGRRSGISNDQDDAARTLFGFQAMGFQQLVELLPGRAGTRLGYNAHARRDDLRAEDNREPGLLKEAQSNVEPATLQGVLAAPSQRLSSRTGAAMPARDAPHDMTILSRARGPRHE